MKILTGLLICEAIVTIAAIEFKDHLFNLTCLWLAVAFSALLAWWVTRRKK